MLGGFLRTVRLAWLVPITGGSCHNYDFCHKTRLLSRQTRLLSQQTRLLSRQTRLLSQQIRFCFVVRKIVIVADPASGRYQLLNHIVEGRGAVICVGPVWWGGVVYGAFWSHSLVPWSVSHPQRTGQPCTPEHLERGGTFACSTCFCRFGAGV